MPPARAGAATGNAASSERLTLPTSLALAHYIVNAAREVIEGLAINVERMCENLQSTGAKTTSGGRLTDLVESGMDRDEAHRLLQDGPGADGEVEVTERAEAHVAESVLVALRERIERLSLHDQR